jgi:hypothetical protein
VKVLRPEVVMGSRLLRPKRRAALVAAASVFAALYAILGTIPVSRLLLGSGNFLTASKFVTPLAGMLFGPFVGGLAVVLGDALDAYAGYVSPSATGLAVIVADLATVATAGLAFSGKRLLSLGLPIAVLLLYWLDPISVLFVGPIPFTWLHMISVIAVAPILAFEKSGRLSRLNPLFVTVVTFAALLCGQLTGTLVGQNLSVRVYGTMSVEAWRGLVRLFFPLYPVERVLFTVIGAFISIPVLRALSRVRGQRPAESKP